MLSQRLLGLPFTSHPPFRNKQAPRGKVRTRSACAVDSSGNRVQESLPGVTLVKHAWAGVAAHLKGHLQIKNVNTRLHVQPFARSLTVQGSQSRKVLP